MTAHLIKNLNTLSRYPNPPIMVKAKSPKDFGKVAVLFGGCSEEREVSLKSGQAVLDALKRQGVDAHGLDAQKDFIAPLIQGCFERVFIVLHGRIGEDGHVQAVLEHLKIPYTGSQVAASALAMDKAKSKLIWTALNLPSPVFGLATHLSQAEKIAQGIELPICVKPVFGGSSIGVSRIDNLKDLPRAFEHAAQYGVVMLEKWIEGDYVSVSIVGSRAYPAVLVKPKDNFYDYQAKYISGSTKYICPMAHSKDEEIALRALALKAYQSLGCQGWGRVDLMRDLNGNFSLLEVNTIPGMTDKSLVPMSAQASGITYDQIVYQILETTLADPGTQTATGSASQEVA